MSTKLNNKPLVNEHHEYLHLEESLENLWLQPISSAIHIGTGGFGSVFQIDTNTQVRPIINYAIKIQITTKQINKPSHDYTNEIKYSELSSKLGIGPHIYKVFYYEDTTAKIINELKVLLDKIPPTVDLTKMKNIIATSEFLHVQFIVMDAYMVDCYRFLTTESSDAPPAVKKKVISKICKLIEDQITSGLYCYDMKLPNFVMNLVGNVTRVNDQTDVDVRMIDYGENMCVDSDSKLYKYIDNPATTLYNNTPGFTYLDMFRVSLLIQVFIMCTLCTSKPNLWLYQGFNTSTRLKNFLSTGHWEENIKKYTFDACAVASKLPIPPEYAFIFYVSDVATDFIKSPTTQKQRQVIDAVVAELKILKIFMNTGILNFTQPVNNITTNPVQLDTSNNDNDDKILNIMIGVGLTGLVGLSGYAILNSNVKSRKSRKSNRSHKNG